MQYIYLSCCIQASEQLLSLSRPFSLVVPGCTTPDRSSRVLNVIYVYNFDSVCLYKCLPIYRQLIRAHLYHSTGKQLILYGLNRIMCTESWFGEFYMSVYIYIHVRNVMYTKTGV